MLEFNIYLINNWGCIVKFGGKREMIGNFIF